MNRPLPKQELRRRFKNQLKRLHVDFPAVSALNLNKDFLRHFHHSSTAFSNLVVDQENYSCRFLLQQMESSLALLAGKTLPEDFLEQCYHFILKDLYPSAALPLWEEDLQETYVFYLETLRLVCEMEKHSASPRFPARYPMIFLSEEEASQGEHKEEYQRFYEAFQSQRIYELMKLHSELFPFTTLDHICGVYSLAMFIARQLKEKMVPIDLGLIAGAAACHDIGKYGCTGSEVVRVPYLHYYYTDVWYKQHNLPYMGNIAVNHSTWDLELENLPVELLVLIYSDFRVKDRFHGSSRAMYIYDLGESFEVILSKLDNVDEAKENRYRRVYAKLKDFEDYMVSLGVQTSMERTRKFSTAPKKHLSLLYGHSLVDHLKNKAIEYNIALMHQLSRETTFHMTLEMTANEGDWRKIRGYLNIFEEYCLYLTQKQKLHILSLLYDLLTHPEEDIRNQSAALMGQLIAHFDVDYRKEVPPSKQLLQPEITAAQLFQLYMDQLMRPDLKSTDVYRDWIRMNVKIFGRSFFEQASPLLAQECLQTLNGYYEQLHTNPDGVLIYFLQLLKHLPFSTVPQWDYMPLIDFLSRIYSLQGLDIHLSVLKLLLALVHIFPKDSVYGKGMAKLLLQIHPPMDHDIIVYLRHQILEVLTPEGDDPFFSEKALDYNEALASEIYLSNLKSATSWVRKKAGIHILTDWAAEGSHIHTFQAIMHLCNLLKVSSTETVRNQAGKMILRLFPLISPSQRNEVCIELLLALEMDDYQFVKYIPSYLGRMIMYLGFQELEELLEDTLKGVKNSNSRLAFFMMKMTGAGLEDLSAYGDRFPISKKQHTLLLHKMLGILLFGLYSPDAHLKHEAFRILGRDLFGSPRISLEDKRVMFALLSKKLCNALADIQKEGLLFLNDSVALNNIYRFISDYQFFKGVLAQKAPPRIAFFPGTFDPFSLSHKGIATAIRDLGYDVYLAVDEFSWSKRTQPNSLRRAIINMSIAGEFNIYTFPEDIQVNISNDRDLLKLKELFRGQKVSLVAGSDVLLNASCYQEGKANAILDFNHIIFQRLDENHDLEKEKALHQAMSRITQNVQVLTLPGAFQNISSSMIRDFIDRNKDISKLVDPLAQKYIYTLGIYRRENEFKTLLTSKSLDIFIREHPTQDDFTRVARAFQDQNPQILPVLEQLHKDHGCRLVELWDIQLQKLIGFASYVRLRSSAYFSALQDNDLCSYVRSHSIGNIALLTGVYVREPNRFRNLVQIALTETLAHCLNKDYTYAIFKNILGSPQEKSILQQLELQGFLKVQSPKSPKSIYVVDMSNPSTLNLDLERMIKEPFRSNETVLQTVEKTRQKLQLACTRLYPGHLLLPFDVDILMERLIEKICQLNGVEMVQQVPRRLGEYMCVPFGAVLEGAVIPNTITKFLHTEKVYQRDLNSFTIEAYPYYMSLVNQMKLLASFNRSVILTDDLLHKGHRMRAIDPLLTQENIHVYKLVFGVLTGRGKEMMDLQGRDVECAYFLPNLRTWFYERNMYPFVGGDSIRRWEKLESYILPSINFILPYASPTFIQETRPQDIYDLSLTCLENTLELMTTLEKEYQDTYGRTFMLQQLSEVFLSPRSTDFGKNMAINMNAHPSEHVAEDLENLQRIKDILFR